MYRQPLAGVQELDQQRGVGAVAHLARAAQDGAGRRGPVLGTWLAGGQAAESMDPLAAVVEAGEAVGFEKLRSHDGSDHSGVRPRHGYR